MIITLAPLQVMSASGTPLRIAPLTCDVTLRSRTSHIPRVSLIPEAANSTHSKGHLIPEVSPGAELHCTSRRRA